MNALEDDTPSLWSIFSKKSSRELTTSGWCVCDMTNRSCGHRPISHLIYCNVNSVV